MDAQITDREKMQATGVGWMKEQRIEMGDAIAVQFEDNPPPAEPTNDDPFSQVQIDVPEEKASPAKGLKKLTAKEKMKARIAAKTRKWTMKKQEVAKPMEDLTESL